MAGKAPTQVQFHDAADALGTAATLLVAAVGDGQAALVLAADPAQAQALDARLWEVGDEVFLPHALADDPHATAASVLIAAPGQPEPARPLLLNLRRDAVQREGVRIIELIPGDEAGKAAARTRWRAYAGRGLKPVKC